MGKKTLINSMLLMASLVIVFYLAEAIAYVQEHFLTTQDMMATKTSTYYLNQILADYPSLKRDHFGEPCRARYNDYYYLSYECQSETLNATSYYWSRNVPDSAPMDGGQRIIWLFGGSTMLNLTASDELTIANQLAKNFNRGGPYVTVVNFGMGGFGSTQEFVKFSDLIRRVRQEEIPDIAIFYDGYNDAAQAMTFGAGNLQEYYRQIEVHDRGEL